MPPEASELPARLAILGTGLLGTSVGLAARRAGIHEIVAFDPDADALAEAGRIGAVTHSAASSTAAVSSADAVVLAAPVPINVKLIATIAEHVAPHGFVTDVGSTKESIVVAAKAAGLSTQFCGAHPMAGSEASGPAAARADLFDGSTCFLVPSGAAATSAKAETFWRALGCRSIQQIDAAGHDELVARISHVPHAVAAALVELAGRDIQLAGPGLRDATRIAAGDPDLWVGILLDNADAIGHTLAKLSLTLDDLRRRLEQHDALAIRAFLQNAATRRRSL